jgi:penicillin amidase
MAKKFRVAALVVGVIVVVPVAYVGWVFAGSRPVLDGALHLAGLSAPVDIVRDADGVPTLTAANRLDLARALGFVHGQERFFQMDLLRRAGAGELSALVGDVALKLDRGRRLFRFRARAMAALAAEAPADRALVDAYTAGVNAGLAALGHAPWEYALLRVPPAPWTAADSLLVTDAMYFDLQDSDAESQLLAAREQRVLGPALAAFLYPRGAPQDAPLDGSHLPEPAFPTADIPAGPGAPAAPPKPEKGSNNFAVAGRLSETGAAIVEDDMHLDLRVPNIWFRARLRVAGGLDMVGVTLPGVPFVVVGSNTHVAWAFTDSYIETGDAVVIEQPPGDASHYRTPQGLRGFETHVEKVCAAHGACEDLPVRDTIWGPIVGRDDAGHDVAWRWVAEDPNAVTINSFLALEGARTVRDALDAAHHAGLPDQNFVVGDSAGHIGWTIIGPVPRRFGLDDQLPHSWADGARGWNGVLAPGEVPEVVDPPDGRLWSANARMLGGAALALVGDGFYVDPARARAIHDDLFARDRFAETDMLHIATDDRAHALDPWQIQMMAAIGAQGSGAQGSGGDGRAASLRPYVADWGGLAAPDSIGYRLVREFRGAVINLVYKGLAGSVAASAGDAVPIAQQCDYVALRLLAARPAGLVPKPFATWDALLTAALNEVAARAVAAPGGLAAYKWGVRNHTGIHHPLAAAVPGLGWLTDPPDVPVAGDALVPRVAIPGFGSSERLVVSPGHEDRAIFEMPAGQSDNPLTPYYGAGQAAWVNGTPTKLLPGPARWRLTLTP